MIRGDVGQIEHVVFNLAFNAQDAMPHGGALLIEVGEVALDKESAVSHDDIAPGAYCVLTVSDTGIGIAKEVQFINKPFSIQEFARRIRDMFA